MSDPPPGRRHMHVYRATHASGAHPASDAAPAAGDPGVRRIPASQGGGRLWRRIVVVSAALAVVAALAAGAWLTLSDNGNASGTAAGKASGSMGGSAGNGGGGNTGAGGGTKASPGAASDGVALVSPSPSPAPSHSSTVIEIGWVGDTTPGSQYGLPPNGGRALFANLRAKLRAADLMIANLEGTYSAGGPSKCDGKSSNTCFAFQAPPASAEALKWAGIDLVNLANNHAYDYLARGLQQTTAALTQAHVAATGLRDQVTLLRVRGVRVAVIGFSPYPWSPNINDIVGARRLVRRASHEADLVVVLMHAGAEGADKVHTPRGPEIAYGEPRGDPRAFAHAVVDAGADLVLGSGPHVVRGIERYKDRLIAYSLGNFAGWHTFALGGNLSLSGLLTVQIDADGQIHGGRWLSLTLDGPGVPRVDSTAASARLVRQLSAEDFAHTYTLDARGLFTGKP